ncbi:MAG: hypothetical protein KJ063_02390 [Anaerolineae bacterium]|nr:hypothetical protein [Anaerolineae bacterium]
MTGKLSQAAERGLNFVPYNGDHLTGVPARNLSPDEVKQLTDKQVLACLATGLYVIAPEKKEKKHE